MTARDLMVDFINFLFVLVVSVFFIYYFVLGNRIEQLISVLKFMAPFSIFGVFFLFKFRAFTNQLKLSENDEAVNEEEAWYPTDAERKKDILITFFLPVIILAIAFIDGEVDKVDIYQALFSFFYVLFFHWIIFRKKSNNDQRVLHKSDRLLDEMIIYFLPVILLALPMSKNMFSAVDILQTLSVFIVLFIWHLVIFKKDN